MPTPSLESIIKGELRRAARHGKGLRKRDLFSPANREGHRIMFELEDKRLIRSELYSDRANMEEYIVYYWVGK